MSGNIFVISAPSGTGKTTVVKRLLAAMPDLQLAVSCTTRKIRAGERNGVDYHFIAEEEFKKMIKQGAFVEWALVHNGHYGTPQKQIDEIMADNKDVLLDVDTQGAAKVRQKYPEALLIFLLPPSIEDVKKRLKARNANSPEDLLLRLKNAKGEMQQRHEYDHQVVNENLDEAVDEITEIISYYRVD